MSGLDYILGIDPGLAGGIAYYTPDHPALISVEDMPVVGGLVDAHTLAARIVQMRPTVAIVEEQSTRPGLAAGAVLKTGTGYGIVLGVIAALNIPVHLVRPQKWKKHFALSPDKEKSRALALRLWPDCAERFARKKDEARAEAALIARYGAEALIIRRAAA